MPDGEYILSVPGKIGKLTNADLSGGSINKFPYSTIEIEVLIEYSVSEISICPLAVIK